MSKESFEVFKGFYQQAEILVSKKFTSPQDRRDVKFLLTCVLMAGDQLKAREGIEDFIKHATNYQSELLLLAQEFDRAVVAFNQTIKSDTNPSHINTISVKEGDKLGDRILPLLLGEREVRPHEAQIEIAAGQQAFAAQDNYMSRSEQLGEAARESGEWSELHLSARSPLHFIATFIVDLYPGMLSKTGMYGSSLDTDELVRALCENLDPKSKLFKLIKEQGWFEDEEFSNDFQDWVTSQENE